MRPEELAQNIGTKIDSISYDIYDDDGRIIFAAVMLEKAVEILRDKGSDGDILLAFSKLLLEENNG